MAAVTAIVNCPAKIMPDPRTQNRLTGFLRIAKAGRRGLMSLKDGLKSPDSSWGVNRLPTTHHFRRPSAGLSSTSISTCWEGDDGRVGAGVGSEDLRPFASFLRRLASATSCAWKARATERLIADW